MPKGLNNHKLSQTWADHRELMEELEKSYRTDRHLRNVCRFIWLLCLVILLMIGHEVGKQGHAEWHDALAFVFYAGAMWVMWYLDKFYSKIIKKRF